MNAKELRIGNLVYNSIEKEYCEITADDILHLSEGMDCFVFEPIPLTDEWLIEFGFEKDKDGVLKISNCMYWLDTGFIQIANGYTPLMNAKCQYVHQLQNLYFALKQKELNYKKENPTL